jgi:hypothetical protein
MTITVGDLQKGLKVFSDVQTALTAKLTNLPADEAVLADAVEIAVAIDPALMPIEVAMPAALFLLSWLDANSKPSQTMIPVERRGNV